MTQSFDTCFSPIVIRGVTIPNRFAMAPMTRRAAADDGSPTDAMAEYYARRAQHGVGLIVTEGVHVNSTDAVDTRKTPQCATPAQIAGWKKVVDRCKALSNGKAVLCMQLWHTGMASADPLGPVDGWVHRMTKKASRAATAADVERITDDFARTAAVAVQQCGFQSVEIHGAHGYFIDAFASPSLNSTRTDAFGGDAAKRAALAVLAIQKVRAAVGPHVILVFRFSQWIVTDYRHVKFFTSAELAAFVEQLLAAGVDVLDASTRRVLDPAFPAEHPTRCMGEWMKRIVAGRCVVTAVGSVSVQRPLYEDAAATAETFNVVDPTAVLKGVEDGLYDIVQIGRGLISDAMWVEKVRQGKWKELASYSQANLRSLL